MRASVDLWKWFYAYEKQARAKNDSQGLQLVRAFNEGFSYRSTDPERSLHIYTQGVDLARKMGEACWELFLSYWVCDLYLFNLKNYDLGLGKAIQNFTLAHQPAYQNCAIIARVYLSVLNAYFRIDARGYITEIRQIMKYMSENVRLDQDTFLVLQHYTVSIHILYEEWDEAEQAALKYLDTAKGAREREVDAYYMLNVVAANKKQIEKAYAYAIEQEKSARALKRFDIVATALIKQAAYHLKIGKKTEAENLYQQARTIIDGFKSGRATGYYGYYALYQIGLGNLEAALDLHDKQLAEELSSRNYVDEIDIRIARLRLMGKLGRSLKDDLAIVYTLTKKLRAPEYYMEKLQKIERGDYADPYDYFE